MIGDEATVAAQLRRLGDAGATDFAGRLVGDETERSRALAVLADVGGA